MSADRTKVKILKRLHFPHFDMYKRSDGIVVLISCDEVFITIREARKFVAAMHEITEGIPHRLLIIPGRHASIDKEARTYMASAEALQDTIARATILSSIAHRVIGPLLLSEDHPPKPIGQFDSIREAITWLKEQKP